MSDLSPPLPEHVLAAALAYASAEADQRSEVFAEDRGRAEHLPDGSTLELITVA